MSIILAIDLGKYISVLCGLDPQSGEVEYRTAKTTPAVLRQELTRRPVDRIVIETCSPAGWVHDFLSPNDHVGTVHFRCSASKAFSRS